MGGAFPIWPGERDSPRERRAAAPSDSGRSTIEFVRSLVARGGHAHAGTDLRRGARSAREVLSRRGELRPGEIVTLLGPIAETLALAHDGGRAHGSVSIDAITIDQRGSPSLGGWGDAEMADGRSRRAERTRDRDGVVHDVTSLAAVIRECAAATLDAPGALRGASPAHDELRAILDRATADGRSPTERFHRVRMQGRRRAGLARERGHSPPRDAPLSASDLGTALYAWAVPAAIELPREHDPPAPVPLTAPGGRVQVRRTRRPRRLALLATLAVCATLAVSIALLEQSHSDTPSPESEIANTVVVSDSDGGQAGEAGEGADDGLGAGAQETAPVGTGDATDRASGDAALATTALLAARDECLAARDVPCLDGVFEADAPSLEADVARIEHPAEVVALAASSCVEVERSGDVALVRCRARASLEALPLDSNGGDILVTVSWRGGVWSLRGLTGGDAAI